MAEVRTAVFAICLFIILVSFCILVGPFVCRFGRWWWDKWIR